MVGTVLVVAIIISLSGLIGLLATGFSFGRILAAWFTVVGFGMLVLVGLVVRFGIAGAHHQSDPDWIKQPVDGALEDRLFAAQVALTAAVGPKPKNCGLLIGASRDTTRSMQAWVRELDRDGMTCHGLDTARDWIAGHEPLFDFIVIDMAGLGAAATADFCRCLREDGFDLPVILVMRFPAQGLPDDLCGMVCGMDRVHIVPGSKVAVKLAILSALEPCNANGRGAVPRPFGPGRVSLQLINGDRK